MPTPWNRSKPSWGGKNKQKQEMETWNGFASGGMCSLHGDKPALRLKSGCEVFLTIGHLLGLPRVNTPLVYFMGFIFVVVNYLQHEYTIWANFKCAAQ